jgi:hypothetical protein
MPAAHGRAALGHRHGRSLGTGAAVAPPVRARQAQRVFAGSTMAAQTSTNWSGYGGVAGTVSGAEGDWTVPAVAPTTGNARFSASWVGVDGFSDQYLIQTGTEQDTGSGVPDTYYPWYEIITPTFAAPETQINSIVEPGDAMYASVEKVSPGHWQIYLSDATRNWYFQQTFSYAGPGSSAEWIEEAPTVNSTQSVPADWGTVDFTHTALYNGTGWASTDMTSGNAIDLIDANSDPVGVPGPISASGAAGQSFADAFEGPGVAPVTTVSIPATTTTTAPPPPVISAPSPPTGVTAWADRLAIRLRWRTPRTDGGQPITRYVIREYTGGHLVRVLYSTTPTVKVGGLSHQHRYLFTVAAANGKFLSRWSAHTAALRPRA